MRAGRMKGFFRGLTLDANVDVVLLTSLGLAASVIGLREGVEGLEILDVCGHMID